MIQLVVVMRWVDDSLAVHEEFLGLYAVHSIEASTIVSAVRDTMIRLNLPMTKVRGQCYDGASNMSGLRKGVATQLQQDEPRAIYTHCYGHSLNLAVGDTVRQCKVLKVALEMCFEITKLIKYSPRRESLFKDLKEEISPGSPGIRVLCPTRWTVRADSMKSIIDNYNVLNEVWEKACDIVKDTETIARIRGIAAQMTSFEFFFGLVLGETLLRHTDNLSRTLQSEHISAAEGQSTASMTVTALEFLRSDDQFSLFWEKVQLMTESRNVDEPKLPRQRKRPKRYEDGVAAPEFDVAVEDRYRRIYFEALDLIVKTIKSRFNQPGYKIYRGLEDLLVKAANGNNYSDELEYVTSVYGSDINGCNLDMQLKTLGNTISIPEVLTIHAIVKHLTKLSTAEKTLLDQVVLVAKLLLVMPATNATSERSFSAMRRLKTYLRSTMGQERLNNLMILHVHKNVTDNLDLLDVAKNFVSVNESRLAQFGKF